MVFECIGKKSLKLYNKTSIDRRDAGTERQRKKYIIKSDTN